ncbi:MAG: FxLYD domain-containing protein [Thermoflexales bacterium]|nr:FxLYD domain-containing protein [Thermoflexales bacterium]
MSARNGRTALLGIAALSLIVACSPLELQLPVYEPVVDRRMCAGQLAFALTQARLYADALGQWWLIGEVRNTVAPVADYASAVIVAQADAQAHQHVERALLSTSLPLRRIVPFRVMLRKTRITNRDLVRVAVCADAPYLNDAEVHEVRYYAFNVDIRAVNPVRSGARIEGEIRNSGEQNANEVFVTVGLYDDHMQLVGVAEALVTDLPPIAPGERVAFTATTNRLLGRATRFAAHAEGIMLQESSSP